MDTPFLTISKAIRSQLDKGNNKFIVYPFGEFGILTKQILEQQYNITDTIYVDRDISKYNSLVHSVDELEVLARDKTRVLLFVSANPEIHSELLDKLREYFSENQINDVFKQDTITTVKTEIGRYCYGPLNKAHKLVKKVGNFCSFAQGCDVVENHPIEYITTHPMLCLGTAEYDLPYDSYAGRGGAIFPGVKPRGERHKDGRITIGNDVWLGRNVIITNGANIGNGVIAGAGAVITKDVPDYAIVVGVPARILRFRFEPDQIEALNKIKWWDWSDDKIRENFDDFYLPVEEFISKHITCK